MSIWVQSADCVGTEVDDSLILIDITGGQYCALNGTAAAIWSVIEQPTGEDAIVEAMVAKYQVAPETCAPSVATALERLETLNMAKRVR
ncbi:PqqD family protein [Sphingomonas donggukensis]|uniref:PqqD family protein n=1 Tax=Sphingomonas donggukensis TaxID=2949093 RepID=A0ABY4TXY1_9SPHN|nr:PqqD family protein [Sphingomonas donggukensis]URW75163.1 PqqD family protein [Sphingomonas donggukensis]